MSITTEELVARLTRRIAEWAAAEASRTGLTTEEVLRRQFQTFDENEEAVRDFLDMLPPEAEG